MRISEMVKVNYDCTIFEAIREQVRGGIVADKTHHSGYIMECLTSSCVARAGGIYNSEAESDLMHALRKLQLGYKASGALIQDVTAYLNRFNQPKRYVAEIKLWRRRLEDDCYHGRKSIVCADYMDQYGEWIDTMSDTYPTCKAALAACKNYPEARVSYSTDYASTVQS